MPFVGVNYGVSLRPTDVCCPALSRTTYMRLIQLWMLVLGSSVRWGPWLLKLIATTIRWTTPRAHCRKSVLPCRIMAQSRFALPASGIAGPIPPSTVLVLVTVNAWRCTTSQDSLYVCKSWAALHRVDANVKFSMLISSASAVVVHCCIYLDFCSLLDRPVPRHRSTPLK